VAQAGYLRRFFTEPHRVLEEIYDREGPVVTLGAGPARLAIIGEPLVISGLFAEPAESFRWNHRFNTLSQWVGRDSLVVSDGSDHLRRRRAVQAGFSRRRINGWIPMIMDAIDARIDRVVDSVGGRGRIVDLYPVGRSLVLDIILLVLSGPRLSDRAPLIDAQLQTLQDFIELPAIRQVPHPFPGGARERVRRARRFLDEVIDEEIDRIRTSPDPDELDVLESLVTDGELSDAEIRDQMVTLIGAGYDTTSASLAWALLRAAATPGLWDRLADEASWALGEIGSGTAVDPASLGTLQLVDRTVRESLRLHPPGAFGAREAVVDIVAGGYRIPRGTLIAWSTHLAGRDPAYWPDPLRFDPDRHLNPTPEQASQAKVAWIPFGGGTRNCLGFALAQVELTLIVARMAQRLRLTPVEANVPSPTRRSRPHGGAPFHVRTR
jgi:cytochrome P450